MNKEITGSAKFWKLPNNVCLAFVPRTGSTAWAQAIIDEMFPDLVILQNNGHAPAGRKVTPQLLLPILESYTGSERLLGVVRDPIERFRSAFSRISMGRSVDLTIANLVGGEDNIHSIPVSVAYSGFNVVWYRHDSDLSLLSTEIGLSKVPDISNASLTEDKPTLTDSQIAILRSFYADDIKLYESIK